MSQDPTVYPAHATAEGHRSVLTETGANIPIQMDKKLFLLDPNANPFTLMTTRLKKRVVGDFEYKYKDDEPVPEFSTLAANSDAAAAAAGSVDWTVQSGHAERFSPWDIVKNMRTGSWGQVVSRNVSSDVVVVDTQAALLAGVAGDVIQRLGNSLEEGAGVVQFKSVAHTTRTNYIQRLTHSVRFTLPAMKAADYHGGYGEDYQREMRKASKQHARDIEWATLLNPAAAQYDADTAITNPADDTTAEYKNGMTEGLDSYIETYSPSENVVDENDLTEFEFYDWLEPCFEYGANEKVLYSSPRLGSAIMRWNLGKIRFEASKNKQIIGLNFATVVTPHGTIKLIPHKMLKARASGHYNYNFLVDHTSDMIKLVNFHGLDTQVKKDVEPDGEHKKTNEIFTYFGTQFRLAEHHGRLRFKTFS